MGYLCEPKGINWKALKSGWLEVIPGQFSFAFLKKRAIGMRNAKLPEMFPFILYAAIGSATMALIVSVGGNK